MDVQSATNSNLSNNTSKVKKDTAKKRMASSTVSDGKDVTALKTDTYQRQAISPKKLTYDNPQYKPDLEAIQKLKTELDQTQERVKQLMIAMFQRQGLDVPNLSDIKIADLKNIKIDKTAQKEAEAMIADGGELSAENVSNRIVDFAKAISGGDRSKLDLLKSAIDEAYDEVKKEFGAEELPEVTQKTYRMIMAKLDAWGKEPLSSDGQVDTVSTEKPGKAAAKGNYVKIQVLEKTITIESFGKPEKTL